MRLPLFSSKPSGRRSVLPDSPAGDAGDPGAADAAATNRPAPLPDADPALDDPLTGLRGRRFVETVLTSDFLALARRRAFGRTGRDGRRDRADLVHGVVMIDVDNFQSVNDRHGRAAGDRWLVDFAKTIRGGIRGDDIAARYEGDTFLALLRNADPAHLSDLVLRLKRRLDDAHARRGDPDLRRSCSLGAASFPFFDEDPELLTFEEVRRLAALALYHVKCNGRDAAVRIAPGSRLPEREAVAEMTADLESGLRNGYFRILTLTPA